jgi:ankyrin repeat protein
LGDQSAVTDALNRAPGTINGTDRHGLTALDWAVMAEDESMTKFLLEKQGADPNGSRALSIAAQSGNINIAKLLLDHGADPSDPKKINPDGSESVNPYRVDPYQMAINFHHPEIAELIKQARKQH